MFSRHFVENNLLIKSYWFLNKNRLWNKALESEGKIVRTPYKKFWNVVMGEVKSSRNSQFLRQQILVFFVDVRLAILPILPSIEPTFRDLFLKKKTFSKRIVTGDENVVN